MKWGARGPVPRAPCLSDASTGNEVNSTHSPLDSIMDLSRFLNGGVKHEGAFDDLAQSIGAPPSSTDLYASVMHKSLRYLFHLCWCYILLLRRSLTALSVLKWQHSVPCLLQLCHFTWGIDL